MRSLSVRLLLSLLVLIVAPAAFAHDVTISGTQTFASLDGSASDHDGSANGVFTVNDGNLVVNGIVNCNDDGASVSACAMAFNVSGDLTMNAGSALFAENRSGGGTGGAITLTVGGNLALNGSAMVSTASKTSSGATGGAISATVGGSVGLGAGSTIDSGSANAAGGSINIAAAGAVSVDGNVLSGPSRTILATRLTGLALDGGTSNQIGGAITIASTTFGEPAVAVSATANIISQGGDGGAGPVTIDGCGITVRGLVAALSRKDSAAKVAIRSGKDVLVDGRDLGGSGTRMGRVRADAPSGTALNKGVDIFATETIDLFGPASGSLFAITSLPGIHDSKSYGGVIRITSLGDAVNGSGNLIDDGHTASGDTGGTVEIAAKEDVNLNTAVIRAHGDFNTNNNNRGGGAIRVRSYSGDVIWTNGTGDVRPVGSTSGLPLADQGSIILTACGTVNTTGSSFPVNGTATSVFPETHTGVCSPAAPSLPSGVAALITCNTPPVANDTSATTNEDTTVTITLSGTDADGDSLTFSIVSGPSNGVLGPIISTGPTTATVDYTPNFNYFGSDSFVFQANDGNGGTDNATASITINPVNDPPSFLIGATVTVDEDSGATTITNWVTAISAGPANETGQTVTFTTTNSNNALFSVQPSVDANGTLTFTLAANASGSATVTVVAQDNGGTANGGDDTSDPQTSTITVNAVNDEPSFTKGADQTVNEDAGPQTVFPWATAISAGPANESGQTLTFVTSNDNNDLFSVQPSVAADGTLTYTPADDAFGTATVSVYLTDDGGTANGGDDTSPTQTFTITVNSVNDAPSFTSGGDVTVDEDSAAYSQAWATDISAGPANESAQTLTFNIVSNSNPSLFASGPSISSTGVLSFTLSADAFGSATIVVNLQDNGGVANGGDDTSADETFTITVNSVNDAPSFTKGADVTVNEDSGAYSQAGWATNISAGPANESGQTLTFNVSNSNNALFSVQPAISPAGELTFTPAANAFGTVTVTVTLSDDGGTANGGDDTSDPQTFTITIEGINDPPAAGADSFATFGNTEVRVDLGAVGTPHVLHTTGSGTGVLHNDSDGVEGDPFSITAVVGCADTTAPFDCVFGDGSVLSLNANGTFSFTPGPGATSASFQYVVTDNPSAGSPASATGTVTIPITEMIWYVNGAAANGNGTSNSPFNSFASLDGPGGAGDVDSPGAYIFVHTSAVSGSIPLEANQKLLGQGVGLTVSGYPLAPAGMKPTVSSAGDTVTVNSVSGVEIAGLSLSSSGGNAIDVTSNPLQPGAGVSIHDNTITGAGLEGIDINAGSTSGTVVNINTTDITSTGNGLNVSSTTGANVSYTNGSITSGATGIQMSGTAVFVTGLSNVTIGGNTAGDGINISGVTFDAIAGGAFNTVSGGSITVGASGNAIGGAGVVLANVSGDYAIGSLTVFGGTSGVTISGSGLYTGAAGMRVTNGGGSINAPAGVGLSVTTATIGAANLNFTSISATGGANGILLNTTDTVGGLIVNGDGTNTAVGGNGSGGTISATAGADGAAAGNGVYLNNAHNVILRRMQISNHPNHGVRGISAGNFTLEYSTVQTAGTNGAGGTEEGTISFDNWSGTGAITGCSISGGRANNLRVLNTTGSLNRLTVTGSTFGNNANAVDSNNNILLESRNAGTTLNFTLQSSTVKGARADWLNASAATGGSMDVVIGGATAALGNSFSNLAPDNHPGAVANGNRVLLQANGLYTYNVSNNTFKGSLGTALSANSLSGTAVMTGTIEGNVIGVAGTANSGSTGSSGIGVFSNAGGDHTVRIENNQVRQYNSHGILLQFGDQQGNVANIAVTVRGNIVNTPGNLLTNFNGLHLNQGTIVTDNLTSCLQIENNNFAGSGSGGASPNNNDIRLRQRQGTTVQLPGYVGPARDNTDNVVDEVMTFLSVTRGNTFTTGTANSVSTGGGYVGGSCSFP